jgi:hypothetical protein
MRFAFVRREPGRERRRTRANDGDAGLHAGGSGTGLDQNELRLAGPDQLEIDLGQDLGVEQRPMLGAA